METISPYLREAARRTSNVHQLDPRRHAPYEPPPSYAETPNYGVLMLMALVGLSWLLIAGMMFMVLRVASTI